MNDPVHAAVMERAAYASRAGNESMASAVSWGAVLGGAFVAAAMSLILLALGSGLGFLAVSPWDDAGAAAKTLGIIGAIWLALTQLVAGALGGYVGGRLRTKWVDVHTDEVYFRDTAHGFLVWAVGLVMTAAFAVSAGTALIGGTAKVGATALAAGGAGALAASRPATNEGATGNAAAGNGYSAYLADRLLRRDGTAASAATAAGVSNNAPAAAAADASNPPAEATRGAQSNTAATTTTAESTTASAGSESGVVPADAATRAEMARLFAVGLRNGELAPADRAYAASVVARRTGMSQGAAERRVDEVVMQARTTADEVRTAADAGRKAAAYTSLWAFASLLLGAFAASYAATRGGRRRDGLVE